MHMFGIYATAAACGLLLGRLGYLMFVDLRLGFSWLFGPPEDSKADQVRLLTYSWAATTVAASLCIINGVSPVWPMLITPFAFVWASELILTTHRLFGPVIERFLVDFHPVDWFYSFFKQGMAAMWTGRSWFGKRRTPNTVTFTVNADEDQTTGQS